MTNRTIIIRGAWVMAIAMTATVGYFVQGIVGTILFPLSMVVWVIGFRLTWFVVDCVITCLRRSARWNQIELRSRLSTTQLQEISSKPTHPDFAFAIGVLARRGIESKPKLDELLGMLLSPDPSTRVKGMSFLFAFYPEIRFGSGASSADSAEVWRERVAAVKLRTSHPTR